MFAMFLYIQTYEVIEPLLIRSVNAVAASPYPFTAVSRYSTMHPFNHKKGLISIFD